VATADYRHATRPLLPMTVHGTHRLGRLAVIVAAYWV